MLRDESHQAEAALSLGKIRRFYYLLVELAGKQPAGGTTFALRPPCWRRPEPRRRKFGRYRLEAGGLFAGMTLARPSGG
jgi:hypothetical protein